MLLLTRFSIGLLLCVTLEICLGIAVETSSAAEQRQVFDGMIISVRNSRYHTLAFDEVNKGLPTIKSPGLIIEHVAASTLHVRSSRFNKRSKSLHEKLTARSLSPEVPKPYSRKTNPCKSARSRKLLKKLRELGH